MANGRIYNFSAGPSMLPLEVLERAGKEITNYQGSGMSVMEMSHRSKVFQKIFDDTKAKFKKLMAVPDDYEVLFLQGGASTQFSAIPLNLIGTTGKADYAVTGNFSNLAYQEAKKYGDIAVACTSEDQDFSYIPTQDRDRGPPRRVLLLLLRQQHHLRHRVAVCPRDRQCAPRVRYVLRHLLPSWWM